MTVIELGEKIAKEIDNRIKGDVISAVVYGTEIHKDLENAKDCNMVLVLEKVGQEEMMIIHDILSEMTMNCAKAPLVVEQSEIEGMGDSVPATFLDVLASYQTVYGRSVFKGLSTISHEHLRAQVEQRLRESLFAARKALIRGMAGGDILDREINLIKNLIKRSLHLYIILKKPWLTDDREKWNSFIEEFAPDNIWLKKHFDEDISSMRVDDRIKLAYEVVESGLKPLLKRVDDMGPE